jgi:hypothetical protein
MKRIFIPISLAIMMAAACTSSAPKKGDSGKENGIDSIVEVDPPVDSSATSERPETDIVPTRDGRPQTDVAGTESNGQAVPQPDNNTDGPAVAEKTAAAATSDVPAQAVTLEKKPEVSKEEEKRLRNFLYAAPGTYGWKTKSDNKMLDFFRDGRLHIQGPDGEMTLWEGKWKLAGDQLTMVRPDLKKTITVPVRIEGKNLKLGDKNYTRILSY